jgi:hypothetical protein
MIKPFNFESTREKKVSKKSFNAGVIVGMFLLFIIGGALLFSQISQVKVLSQKQTKTSKNSLTFPNKNMLLQQVRNVASGIGLTALNLGKQAGGAILGETVKFVQKNASESAGKVASTAANMVIKNTVPALVNQIDKLPPDQKKQVKEYLCK